MVLSQVGEHADIELDAADPLLYERVGADLDHAGLAVGPEHLGHHLLDFQRLGRRALRGNHPLADFVADGADQATIDARRLENLFHYEGHRRLAVRAGDADDPQLAARMLVEGGCRPSERRACVGNLDLRGALGNEPVVLANNRGGAAVDRSADIGVSVRFLPRDGHKDHARRHPARVIGQPGHIPVERTFDAKRGERIDQLFQLHWHINSSLRIGPPSTRWRPPIRPPPRPGLRADRRAAPHPGESPGRLPRVRRLP